MSLQLIQYLTNEYPGLLVGVVFLFGLVFGSFFNVVIYRLPIMMKREWLTNTRDFLSEVYGKLPAELEKNPPDLKEGSFNLVTPNSTCPHCGHEIRWHENIPVLSYLRLRGKCSACRGKISARYPIMELVTGLLSAFIAWKMGLNWSMFAVLVFSWALLCLTMIDFDHHLLPDEITLPLMWLGLLLNMHGWFTDLHSALYGAVGGYLLLWSVYWLFKLLTGKEGMGYGDFKLLAALGAWMGWQALPLIILLSSVVGSVIGIAFIVIQGRDKDIPIAFGPYLAMAGWIAFFWGDEITRAAGF